MKRYLIGATVLAGIAMIWSGIKILNQNRKTSVLSSPIVPVDTDDMIATFHKIGGKNHFPQLTVRFFQRMREVRKNDICACLGEKEEEESCVHGAFFGKECDVSPLCNAVGVRQNGKMGRKYCNYYTKNIFTKFLVEKENQADILQVAQWIDQSTQPSLLDVFYQDWKRVFSIPEEGVTSDWKQDEYWKIIDRIFTRLRKMQWEPLFRRLFSTSSSAETMMQVYTELGIRDFELLWKGYYTYFFKEMNFRGKWVQQNQQLGRILSAEVFQTLHPDVFLTAFYHVGGMMSSVFLQNQMGGKKNFLVNQYFGLTLFFQYLEYSLVQINVVTNPLNLSDKDRCIHARFLNLKYQVRTMLGGSITHFQQVEMEEELRKMESWEFPIINNQLYCPVLPIDAFTNLPFGNKFQQMHLETFRKRFTIPVDVYTNMPLSFEKMPSAEKQSAMQQGKLQTSSPLPEAYDFFHSQEHKYSNCTRPAISQGGCASCWAFATVGAFSHRWCKSLVDRNLPIPFQGKIEGALSPQMLLSCIKPGEFANDCDNGGNPTEAMQWLSRNKISNYQCAPLISQGLDEHHEMCANYTSDIPTCFEGVRAYAKNTFLGLGETQMMQAIMNGPIPMAMKLPATFMAHREGIFNPPPGTPFLTGVDGVHIMQFNGWGTSPEGVPYWIVENSWGNIYKPFDEHHHGGFLRIARNNNLTSIETFWFVAPGLRP